MMKLYKINMNSKDNFGDTVLEGLKKMCDMELSSDDLALYKELRPIVIPFSMKKKYTAAAIVI